MSQFTGSESYGSDVKLGERYRDPQTGIEGVATSIHFYQYACERVTLEMVAKDGELKEYTFDAPRLENAATGERARTERTGGPGGDSDRPGNPARATGARR
jgi:hypothetical protein